MVGLVSEAFAVEGTASPPAGSLSRAERMPAA